MMRIETAPGAHVFCSEVADGNMDYRFSDKESVNHARNVFLASCGIQAAQSVALVVEHADGIHVVTTEDLGSGMMRPEDAIRADALITHQAGVALFLLTADCMPCVLFDPVRRVLALVHLGWRGVDIQLITKVLALMHERYSSQVSDIHVSVGPHISPDSYIVQNPEQRVRPQWQGFIHETTNGFSVDIYSALRAQLLQSGVETKHITTCGIDTATSLRFFSHYRATRREEAEGRLATVAVMRE